MYYSAYIAVSFVNSMLALFLITCNTKSEWIVFFSCKHDRMAKFIWTKGNVLCYSTNYAMHGVCEHSKPTTPLLDTCRCGVVLATSLTWKAIGILFTCCSVKVQLTENIPNVTNTADHCRRWSHIVFIRGSPLYSWGNDPVRHGAVFLNAYYKCQQTLLM